MTKLIEPLEQDIYKLTQHDGVESIELDTDDLHEGFLHVHIALEEGKLDQILKEEGYE